MGWGNEPPESGEFFFNGRLWQKNSLKGGSKCTELVSSTRKLAPGQDETSKSALVAAVELLFCLPPFGTLPSSVWDFLSTVTATVFPSWISFIFAPVGFLSGCVLLSLGLCLHPFGTLPSSVWDFHTTVTPFPSWISFWIHFWICSSICFTFTFLLSGCMRFFPPQFGTFSSPLRTELKGGFPPDHP